MIVSLKYGFRKFLVLHVQNTDLNFVAIHTWINFFYFILAYQILTEVADFITVKGSAYEDMKDKVKFQPIPPYFKLGKFILQDEEKQEIILE